MKIIIVDREAALEGSSNIIVLWRDMIFLCKINEDRYGFYLEPLDTHVVTLVEYLFGDYTENRFDWQIEALGYSSYTGRFPSCKTKEDVLKLLDYIVFKNDLIVYEERRDSERSSE